MIGLAKNGGVAAFFDLDGTLLRRPSLEQRFFRQLRYRRQIGFWNYAAWLRECLQLLPGGMNRILQENKMYLRGVPDEQVAQRSWLAAIEFFGDGMKEMAWHVGKGHSIVLVSGTLEFLALHAAEILTQRLAESGKTANIRVYATRLESKKGRWTGRIAGNAMIGREKEFAVRKVARELRVDLKHCYAYGDTIQDQWMLGVVGNAAVVNASTELQAMARLRDWRVLQWKENTSIRGKAARERELEKMTSVKLDVTWKKDKGLASSENSR